MYIPAKMQIKSIDQAHEFIDEFSFGSIISQCLEGTELPFLLKKDEGDSGTLYCHFARSNSHWQNLGGKQVLIIFNGPHAYISPTWYATQPAVPTWNYASVHVYGQVESLDEAQTLQVARQMTDKYEPSLADQGYFTNIDDALYQKKLAKAIVACKIVINKIDAKQKLGQHRKSADQQGVVKGLSAANDHNSQGLLTYMHKFGIGLGENE
jgi:transcriptional regulator